MQHVFPVSLKLHSRYGYLKATITFVIPERDVVAKRQRQMYASPASEYLCNLCFPRDQQKPVEQSFRMSLALTKDI